jgi:hypothetical protein
MPMAERAEVEELPAWSGRERLWVIGVVLLLAGAVLGGIERWNRPPTPDDAIQAELYENAEKFRQEVPHYTVAQTRTWFERRSETELRSFARLVEQHPYHAKYREVLADNENWSLVAWGLAGLGAVVIAMSHIFAALTPGARRSSKIRKGGARSI